MHSTSRLLLLLWSLLSSTLAAPTAKGLRYDKDIYTVERHGDAYHVYTPYYERQYHRPITTL
ncbi:hypothetical protein LX32DRAFT_492526, partial [Colletotrichum zoysiae]